MFILFLLFACMALHSKRPGKQATSCFYCRLSRLVAFFKCLILAFCLFACMAPHTAKGQRSFYCRFSRLVARLPSAHGLAYNTQVPGYFQCSLLFVCFYCLSVLFIFLFCLLVYLFLLFVCLCFRSSWPNLQHSSSIFQCLLIYSRAL